MLDRRFQTQFEQEPTAEPGLVLDEDGVVYVVLPGGQRIPLNGDDLGLFDPRVPTGTAPDEAKALTWEQASGAYILTNVATQAELDNHAAQTTDAHGGVILSSDPRVTSELNFKHFGGSPDNTPAENDAALELALDAVRATGVGASLYCPAGDYEFADEHECPDWFVLRGDGPLGLTEWKWVVDGVRGLISTLGAGNYNYLRLQDITLRGHWAANQTLGGDGDRLVDVRYYRRVDFVRVHAVECRQMSLTAGYCDEANVDHCFVEYSARDAINLTTCRRTSVTFNRISHCGDDAIAVHSNQVQGNPSPQLHVAHGNIIEDSYGIKMLGLVRGSITGNHLFRVKGYGVRIGLDPPEGLNDNQDVIISGNVVNDVLNSNLFGGGDEAEYVYVTNNGQAFVRPVQGGAVPVITKPDSLSYLSNVLNAQNAGAQRIKIHDNIFASTLPPVANYSDWGFGEAFTSAGMTDPNMSGIAFTQFGIRLNGYLLSVLITENLFEYLNYGVAVDSGISYLGYLRVAGNVFRRYRNHGVSLETGSLKKGRVEVVNNSFNGDPLFESPNRAGAGNGTWGTGAQAPTAVNGVRFDTIEVSGNEFENLNQVFHYDVFTHFVVGPNTYIFEPAAAYNFHGGNGNGNKGIRVPHGITSLGARLVAVNSDPLSSDYGDLLGQSYDSAASIPTSGFYIADMVVRNTAMTEAGSVSSKYVVVGWQRLTTGSAHAAGTDWRELRALTGN